jgi:uncharacterized RmlC-like cupin family protein
MQHKILITKMNYSKVHVLGSGSFNLEVLQTKANEIKLTFTKGSVVFYLQEGFANFSNELFASNVLPGMYFSQKAPIEIKLAAHSKALIISTDFYNCLNLTGGPIEPIGRLDYINGCSDTLLIQPSRLGEPCLNLLHFPANTIQTAHHHPSFRFGIVASGQGESVSVIGSQKLNPGDCFFIPAFIEHKFNTYDHFMNVIAFHPDSDWGPTDEVHPMKNRTVFT